MENGIYNDMSIDAYHDNKTHLSSTTIRKARKSLKSMHYYMNNKQEKKSCFDFGNVFEIALIEGLEGINKTCIIFDENDRPEKEKGITSKINQVWKKGILNGDKYVINRHGNESLDTINKMLESCKSDETIKRLLNKIDYQTSIFWTCPKSGMKLKTRPDVSKANKNVLVDIKTAVDGSPKEFARAAATHDYPLQSCLQIKGCIDSGLMQKVDAYYWLVVEKTPPYHATIYNFTAEDIKYFNVELDYLIEITNKALIENSYPGYEQQADNKYGILDLKFPLWYKNML